MSDTKTTTDDERLAWELACAEEEQPSAPFDEWSRKDRAKMLRIVAKARELLAPAAVALEPLSEEGIEDALHDSEPLQEGEGLFHHAARMGAKAQRAKLTRRPAESGTAQPSPTEAKPEVATLVCDHPASHRCGSADTSGKITVNCGKCGERLPLLGTPTKPLVYQPVAGETKCAGCGGPAHEPGEKPYKITPELPQPPEAAPPEVSTADDLDSATVWALAEALSKRFMWNGQHSKKVAIEALLFLGDEAELRGQLLKAEQDLKELEGAFHQSISTGVERAEALARQAEAHERKLGAVKSDLKLWTEKLDEAERRLRIVNTDIEGVWFWQGDGHDDPVSLACPVVMSADTLREMVAQAEAHAREAQLTVARLIEDLAKKAGCLVTRLDTKKQGSK